MAQVTMTGTEYVDMVQDLRVAQEQAALLMAVFVNGQLKVDKNASYKPVTFECYGRIPDGVECKDWLQYRIEHVTEQLEENPLAVQLLYDNNDTYFNPHTGDFTSYSWDDNVKVMDLSIKLCEMMSRLEAGERLVDETQEVAEDEAE